MIELLHRAFIQCSVFRTIFSTSCLPSIRIIHWPSTAVQLRTKMVPKVSNDVQLDGSRGSNGS